MADAEFLFQTNIRQVADEIESGLRRIAEASSPSTSQASGDFFGDLSGKLRRQVDAGIREIRRLESEYAKLGRSGGTLSAGQPTLSAAIQGQLRALATNVNSTIGKASLKAPSELGALDLTKLSGDINKHLGDSLVAPIRERLRALSAELGADSKSIFGTAATIRPDKARNNLQDLGTPQAQQDAVAAQKAAAAAERRAAKAAEREAAAAEKAAAAEEAKAAEVKAASAGGAGRGGGTPPPTPPPAAAPPPEPKKPANQLPSVADLKKQQDADAERINRELAQRLLPQIGRPNSGVGYLRNTPGSASRIFDETSGAPQFFKRVASDQVQQIDPKADYAEWHAALTDYIARLRYLAELAAKRAQQEQADLQKQGATQAKAQRENVAGDAKAQDAAQKRGVLETKAARDDAARTAKAQADVQAQGVVEEKAYRDDANRTRRQRIDAERAAAKAAEDVAAAERAQAKLITERLVLDTRRGEGGVGQNFLAGFTSTGFSGHGSLDGNLDGLAKSAGISAKYALIGTALFQLSNAASQAVTELLDANDSVTELEVAMGKGAEVTQAFQNDLQTFAAVGGFNVGEAMDVAASGIRAFRDETNGSKAAVQSLGEDFAKQSARIAVISKTTLTDASGNLKAIASGFNLPKNDVGFTRAADAIAGGKLVGGGDEKQIGQGLANSALIFKEMGFSVEESAAIISKIVAETDQSGQLVANRLSRISAILGGSSGKKFIADLNSQLAPKDQIDTTASLRDQVLQLSKVYGTLSDSQQKVVNSSLGGTANQRELIILLQSLGQVVQETNKGFDGKAAEEYAKRLENLRAVLTSIGGAIKGITVNVATSGAFDPLFAVVEALKPALELVRQLTAAFDLLPHSLRTVAFAALELLAAFKGIQAIRNAGGFQGFLANAEARISPQRQAAAVALTENFQRREQAIRDQAGGVPNAQQQAQIDRLEAERVAIERRFNLGIEEATAARLAAERAAATTAAASGNGVSRALQASANAQRDVLRGARDAVATGVTGARERLRTDGVRVVASELGSSAAGRIRAGAGAVASGAGQLAAGIGPIGGALIGADLALQIHGAASDIKHARELAANELGKQIDVNASAMRDSANSLRTAASNIDEATSGFFGGVANALQGGAGEAEASRLRTLAAQRDAAANTVASIQANERQGKSGIQGVAASIDFTSAQSVADSLKALEDSGQSAATRLAALTLAIHNLDFQATGSTKDLTEAQQKQLGVAAGPLASAAFNSIIDATEKSIPQFAVRGTKLGGDNPFVKAFNAVNIPLDGGASVDPRAKASEQLRGIDLNKVNSLTQSAVSNELAKGVDLNSDAGKEGLRQILKAQYEAILIPPDQADKLAQEVAGQVKDQAAKLLGSTATVAALQGAITSGITTSQTAGQDKQLEVQLAALRTGGQDASSLAGAKTQVAELAGLRKEVQAKIQQAIASGLLSREGGAALLGEIVTAQAKAEANYLQALRANAEADIAVMEEQRQSEQNRATSAAQIKAIGERYFKAEVSKALIAKDTDALIKILDNANTQEVATVKTALQASISVQQTAIQGALQALAAASALGGQAYGYSAGEALVQYQQETQRKLQDQLAQLNVLNNAIKRSKPDTKGGGVYATGSDVKKGGGKTDTAAQIAAARQAALAAQTGGSVQEATAAVAVAKADFAAAQKNTVAYYTAQGNYFKALRSLAAAQVDAANLVKRLSVDGTDSVAVANAELASAKAKLASLQKEKSAADVINAAKLEVQNAQNSAESAAFSQRLQDAQTNEELGRISHQAYLAYLQSEHDRLFSIKNKTRQQIDELNQIDLAIKTAADQVSGQFNLGDIKIPTPYEVRRYLTTQAAGVNYVGGSSSTTNNIYINGADTGMVQQTLYAALGTAATARVATSIRRVGAA